MPDDDAPHSQSPDEEPAKFMAPPEDDDATLLAPAVAPEYEVIGDFEIHAKLGAGGMGAVYRARQISLGRMVALKVLPQHAIDDPDSVARFQREARVAASLAHGNLVKVYSAGEADGCHYIAMELIEGQDLGQRIKREKKLTIPEALRIVADVARGLQHGWKNAHIVHRDIKPGNIFLSAHGEVKLGDLGLAKSALGSTTSGITQTGTMMGTPYYISPEQARADKELDFRADIYSLGCTLYHMLTGEVPYRGSEAITIIRQHLDAPLPAIMKVMPQCPIPLARLVGKMLKKSRHERHGSYDELIMQIESVWAQVDPQSYHPPTLESVLPSDPDATLLQSDAIDTATLTPRTATPRVATASIASAPLAKPKSKLPLYGGLAAGVIVLGVIAALVWPRQEKLTLAEIAIREREAAAANATPLPASAPTMAGGASAIRLWGSPDTFSSGPQVRWEDGAIRLDGSSLKNAEPALRNAIVRASVRMNPDAKSAQIALRAIGRPGGDNYKVSVNHEMKSFEMAVTRGGVSTQLRRWPFPRAYRADEWLRLELKAIDDTLTVTADGKEVGTVRDTSLNEAGGVLLYANEKGYFRDVEYVSLDKAAAPSPTPGEWRNLLANLDPQKVAHYGEWKMQDGALVCTKRMPWSACELPFEDPGLNYDLRYRITRGPGARLATFLPFRRGDGGGTVILDYYNEGFGDGLRRAGLDNIKDTKLTDNGLTVKRPMFLPEGQQTTVLVQVRERSLAVRVGDDEIFRWEADWPKLAQGRGADGGLFQHLPKGRTIGIGIFDSQMAFHAIELRKLSETPALVQDSPARPSERWQDLLADPEMQRQLHRTGNTFEVLTRAETLQPFGPDGVIRCRFRYDPEAKNFRVRGLIRDNVWHQVAIDPDGGGGKIEKIDSNVRKSFAVPKGNRWMLKQPLQAGDMVDVEMRIAGSTLSATINGQKVFEGEQGGLTAGAWGVSTDKRTVLERLEFLGSGSGRDASGISASPWMNAMSDPCWTGAGPEFRQRVADGWLLPKARIWILKNGPAGPDAAMRTRHRFTDHQNWPHVAARIADDNWYFVAIEQDFQTIRVTRKLGSVMTILAKGSLAAPLRPGDEVEAELRVVGAHLTARVNGAPIVETDDAVLKEGGFGVWVNSPKEILLQNIESLDFGVHPAGLSTAAAAKASESPNSTSANPARAAGTVDLLPRVSLSRDVVAGEWSIKPTGLSLDSSSKFGICELPYEPPEEYDLEASFTPTSGGNNVNFHLYAGGSSFIWKLNAHGRTPPIYGLDLLDGKVMPLRGDEAFVTAPLRLEAGRRYTTRVEVRRDGVKGMVNGELLFQWSGDYRRLSTEATATLRHPRALAIGSYARAVIFHQVTVREVSGAGRWTDATSSSAELPGQNDR